LDKCKVKIKGEEGGGESRKGKKIINNLK